MSRIREKAHLGAQMVHLVIGTLATWQHRARLHEMTELRNALQDKLVHFTDEIKLREDEERHRGRSSA